jgi:hypothetical protein
MLTSGGEIVRLIVLSDHDIDSQVEFAERYRAPRSVIDDIAARRRIACFFEAPDPLGDTSFPWADYLHDARITRGDSQPWYTAIVRGMPHDIDFDPSISSFDRHLDSIDHLALG